MRLDLNWFFRNYNPDSPHHIAAVNELAQHLSDDQLSTDADWVCIYEAAEMELNYNSNNSR
jgi:hypothetical protein